MPQLNIKIPISNDSVLDDDIKCQLLLYYRLYRKNNIKLSGLRGGKRTAIIEGYAANVYHMKLKIQIRPGINDFYISHHHQQDMLKVQIETTDNTDVNVSLIKKVYWLYNFYKCGTNYKSARTGKRYAIELTGLTEQRDDYPQRMYIATVWHTKTAVYVHLRLKDEINRDIVQ